MQLDQEMSHRYLSNSAPTEICCLDAHRDSHTARHSWLSSAAQRHIRLTLRQRIKSTGERKASGNVSESDGIRSMKSTPECAPNAVLVSIPDVHDELEVLAGVISIPDVHDELEVLAGVTSIPDVHDEFEVLAGVISVSDVHDEVLVGVMPDVYDEVLVRVGECFSARVAFAIATS